jgi:hypothetical protein
VTGTGVVVANGITSMGSITSLPVALQDLALITSSNHHVEAGAALAFIVHPNIMLGES